MFESVYDWQHRKRLNYFCNGNYKGTSITALDIINQDVGGIIMTGSGKYLPVSLYKWNEFLRKLEF
jgi:regulatory associated protein of mTOR